MGAALPMHRSPLSRWPTGLADGLARKQQRYRRHLRRIRPNNTDPRLPGFVPGTRLFEIEANSANANRLTFSTSGPRPIRVLSGHSYTSPLLLKLLQRIGPSAAGAAPR